MMDDDGDGDGIRLSSVVLEDQGRIYSVTDWSASQNYVIYIPFSACKARSRIHLRDDVQQVNLFAIEGLNILCVIKLR